MIKYIFIIPLVFSIACSPKTKSSNGMDSSSDTISVFQDCFNDRTIEKRVDNLTVELIMKDKVYFFKKENTHYEPCDLPDGFYDLGELFVISGEVLSLFPNERRMGQPFHLETISRL